jgi:hypothetical protein
LGASAIAAAFSIFRLIICLIRAASMSPAVASFGRRPMSIALQIPQHGRLPNAMADDPCRLFLLSMIA